MNKFVLSFFLIQFLSDSNGLISANVLPTSETLTPRRCALKCHRPSERPTSTAPTSRSHGGCLKGQSLVAIVLQPRANLVCTSSDRKKLTSFCAARRPRKPTTRRHWQTVAAIWVERVGRARRRKTRRKWRMRCHDRDLKSVARVGKAVKRVPTSRCLHQLTDRLRSEPEREVPIGRNFCSPCLAPKPKNLNDGTHQAKPKSSRETITTRISSKWRRPKMKLPPSSSIFISCTGS